MLIPQWSVSIGSSRHIIPIFTSPMSLISSLRILTVSYLSFRTYPRRTSLVTCLSNPHLPFSILTCCHLPCHPSITVISLCIYTVLLPSPSLPYLVRCYLTCRTSLAVISSYKTRCHPPFQICLSPPLPHHARGNLPLYNLITIISPLHLTIIALAPATVRRQGISSFLARTIFHYFIL